MQRVSLACGLNTASSERALKNFCSNCCWYKQGVDLGYFVTLTQILQNNFKEGKQPKLQQVEKQTQCEIQGSNSVNSLERAVASISI